MPKKCCLLVIMICLLTSSAFNAAAGQSARDTNLQSAFESDNLTLREIQLVPDFAGYTLRVSAAVYAQKAEMEGTAPTYPADGEWVTLDLNSQDFHAAPYFFSPDGSKAILMDEEHAYILSGNVITMILPNYLRGVRDEYASFSRFLKMKPTQWAGSEGLIWSPDGRYAVLTSYATTLIRGQFIYGLYLIDTQTGELFCADTYPNMLMDGGASVFQACFDETGRYVYYMLWGSLYEDSRISLMRYDMQTGMKQRLLACPHFAAYPKLQLDSAGRLFNLLDNTKANEPLGLSVYQQEDGNWVSTAYTFSKPMAAIRPMYMEIGSADMGVMLHNLSFQGKSSMAVGRFFADGSLTGYDELLLIEGFDAPRASILPLPAYGDGSELGKKTENGRVLLCLNIQLSPDGRYAMILATDRKSNRFLMMDMATLELKKVESPSGTASLSAGRSNPMSMAYPCGYNWFEGNKLIILTEDGLKLYEFAF